MRAIWDELACPLEQAMLARVCALADPQEVGQPLGSCIVAYVDARGPIDVGPMGGRRTDGSLQRESFTHIPGELVAA